MPSGYHAHARADGAAIRFRADALDLQPVVSRTRIIAEERGRLVHVDYGDINVSIVVEVAEGRAAAGARFLHRRPAYRGNIRKAAVAEVLIQNLSLFEGDMQLARVTFKQRKILYKNLGN